jgi:hypothetical protein
MKDTYTSYRAIDGKEVLWFHETGGNCCIEQINAGRNYLGVNLQATKLGLHMHLVSQGLQEYAGMQSI